MVELVGFFRDRGFIVRRRVVGVEFGFRVIVRFRGWGMDEFISGRFSGYFLSLF